MRRFFKNMVWMLTATLAMAACSDSLDESSGNGNSNEYIGDKGYVNIGINLPTTASTRANDSFEDGLADEYKVSDVIIALFYDTQENSGESNATCKYAFKLNSANFIPSGDETGNVTTLYASGVRMIEVPKNHVYALAIVNPTSNFTVTTVDSKEQNAQDTGDAVLTTTLGITGVTGDITLETLNAVATINSIDDVTKKESTAYFMMTNAPIASSSSFTYTASPSADFKVTTLAPIKVYNDKSLAEGASKDNPIYVERVVAKTQVKIGDSSTDGSLTVNSDVTAYQGATVQFGGWKLQNTNKKYYPVRKVTDATMADWADWAAFTPSTSISTGNNRFFGITAKPYRTYWGIDPNYATDSNDDYNVITTEPTWNSVGYNTTSSDIEYCLENTTTAQTMQNKRLTSVILKGTFTPKDAQSGDDFFMINNTSAIYTEEEFLKVATAAITLSIGEKLALKDDLNEGLDIIDEAGVKTLLKVSGRTANSEELQDAEAKDILNSSAIGGSIKYYQGGVTYYYTTVIRHFDETEAPLEKVINLPTDYTEEDHLGRWGVVRNNWYELEITKVTGPGEPVLPDDGGGTTPPDKTASYINCEINVLSWAKRSQGVDL